MPYEVLLFLMSRLRYVLGCFLLLIPYIHAWVRFIKRFALLMVL